MSYHPILRGHVSACITIVVVENKYCHLESSYACSVGVAHASCLRPRTSKLQLKLINNSMR
jgi:hypothetical protein